MAFRLLRYVVRILERHRAEHPAEDRLPLVIPLVFHHGPSGWTALVDVAELFDVSPRLPGGLGCLPSMRFLLDDLARVDDEVVRWAKTPRRQP